jgi:hypothetical protein
LPAARQPFVETYELRLHNLDVVVTDEQGQPVRGLTKEDFIVLENEVPQTITNFSVYEDGAATVVAASGAEEVVREKAPPRRFVFFVVHASRLRTRTEVVDRSPEREMGDLTSANLLFPRERNELRVAVMTAGKPTRGRRLYTVRSMW